MNCWKVKDGWTDFISNLMYIITRRSTFGNFNQFPNIVESKENGHRGLLH